MSDIVSVRHAVPYRVVPRRARNERFVLATATTPARLRRVPAGAMERSGRVGLRVVHSFEGGTWVRLGRDVPYPREAIVGMLQGDAGFAFRDYEDLYHHLLRTPVLGIDGNDTPMRGDFDTGTAREIVWDGSQVASEGVARFVGDDMVEASDGVYARIDGPVVLFGVTRDRISQTSSLFPRGWYEACKGAIPSDATRVRHVLETLSPDVVNRQTLPEMVTGSTSGGPGDVDMVLLANVLPQTLIREFSVLPKDVFPVTQAHSDDIDSLRRWRAYGSVSGVRGPMVSEALHGMGEILSRMRSAFPLLDQSWEVRLAHLFIGEVVEPRLAGASPMSDEDAEAMGWV